VSPAVTGCGYGIRSPEYSLVFSATCAAVSGSNSEAIFGAIPRKLVIFSAAIEYYLRAFFMHLPIALHLAGFGQPGQGLNAAFFPFIFM